MCNLVILPHSDPIDLTEWNLDEAGEIVTEVIKEAFEKKSSDGGPYAYLPITYSPEEDGYGGAAVTDPLTIYIALPLSSTANNCVFTVTLGEFMDDALEFNDPEEAFTLSRALRDLADKIEKVYGHVP